MLVNVLFCINHYHVYYYWFTITIIIYLKISIKTNINETHLDACFANLELQISTIISKRKIHPIIPKSTRVLSPFFSSFRFLHFFKAHIPWHILKIFEVWYQRFMMLIHQISNKIFILTGKPIVAWTVVS